MNTKIQPAERFSVPSLVAVASAVLTFLTGPILGLIFAVVALIAGLLGVVLALSPSKRGGIASSLAIVGGALGIVAAFVKLIMWIF